MFKNKLLKKTFRIFEFFRPYWKEWVFLFIVSLFLSAIALANPLIMRFLIDNVLLAKNYALLKVLMLFFVGLTIISTAVRILTRYFYQKLALKILADIRAKLFAHLELLDIGFFQKKKMGDILTRLITDIVGIEEFISLAFNVFLTNLLAFIFIVSISLYLNWKITLLTLLIVPFHILSQRYYAGRLRSFYRLLKRQGASLMSFFEEKLSAMALVQLFGREEYELEEERKKMNRLIGTGLKTTLIQGYAGAIIGLLTFSALLFVLWYGGYQVILGILSLGSFVALFSYLSSMFGPIEALVGLFINIQNSLASVDRVFQIFDIRPAVQEKLGAPNMPAIKGEIIFENVSFSYEENEILKDINFKIRPGEVIGIVGESGTGKTTLGALLARFYDPTSGRVLIDGQDIREVDIQSLRQQIGLTGQNIVLFNTSIRENLTYGWHGKNQEEITAVAKAAAIYKTIAALPRGFKTRLGEKGMTLSGGERERLALARVILKKPNLVFLDEATSFLDFKTELEVLDNVRKVFVGKTIFIVAHHLSTLENADRIIVLKHKTIAEVGTFQELLAKDGEFFNLYSYQGSSSSQSHPHPSLI